MQCLCQSAFFWTLVVVVEKKNSRRVLIVQVVQRRSLKSIWSTPGDPWGQSAHNQKAWIQVLWHFFLKSLSIITYSVLVKVLSHPKGWVMGKEPPTALYISWMISNKYCLALLNTGLDSTSLDISISRSKRWLSKEDCQFFSANLNNSRIFSTHLNRVKQSEMALVVHLCTSQKWLLLSNFGKVCQRTVLCA